MTDHFGTPADHADLAMLRQDINERMAGFERWLERVTLTLEKLAENKERVSVLEHRSSEQERRLDKVETRVAEQEHVTSKQEAKFARFDVAWGLAAAGGGYLLSAIGKHFGFL